MKRCFKRAISYLLAVILCICIVPMGDVGIKASAVNHTVTEAMGWCDSLVNKKVGSGQCVALIQSYYQYLGAPISYGNGCDYATNTVPSGWTRVKGGVPQAGDILVYVGAKYGHVAIYAGGNTSYHQNMSGLFVEKKTNWPYNKSWNSKAEGGTKSYWGYIRPNFNNAPINVEMPVCTGAHIGLVTDTTFRPCCPLTNTSSLREVLVAVWSKDDQSDLVWYGTVNNGANTFFNDIKFSDHAANAKAYHCHFYATLTDGKQYLMGAVDHIIDITPPVISNVKVEPYPTGYLVTCNVSDNVGVTRVRFPSWTDANGQDDIIWHEGTINGNTVQCWIDKSTHNNETGTYITHIYAYDNVGNEVQWSGVSVYIGNCSLDLNGWTDGEYNGGIGYYGTADVYINGSLVSSGCWDFCKEYPSGTKYEIKNIKAADGKTYNGVHSGSLSGVLGTSQITSVVLDFSTYTGDCYLDLNGWLDGTNNSDIGNYGTADIYINGALVSSGREDFYIKYPSGTRYEIKNIKAVGGKTYNGVHSGSLSGVLLNPVTTVVLDFSTNKSYNIYFNANNGNCSTASKTVIYQATYGSLPTPTRTGYTFDGWYTSATGGTKITASTKVTITSNQTLYAHWSHTHSYTSTITKAATCTAKGVKTYTCTVCSATKTEEIAALGHNYSSAFTVDTPATCTTAGSKSKHCSRCSATTEVTAISATGHTSDGGKVTKFATCTATGTKTYTCTVCKTVIKTETIAKLAHNYTVTTIKATCTKDGSKVTKCSVCGDVKSSETIKATGHTKVVSKVAVSPTCTKAGNTVEEKCSVCGTVLLVSKTIPATGHTDKNNDGKCDDCGTNLGTAPTEPTDPSANCSCNCHKGGFMGFIWKIINFFNKLFRSNQYCACGAKHW